MLAQLDLERNAIKSLGPDDASKKMKMTSKMFVLAAKLETSQNLQQSKRNQLAQSCGACVSPKKSTAGLSSSRSN